MRPKRTKVSETIGTMTIRTKNSERRVRKLIRAVRLEA
jgi:hypothetical protein